MGSGGYLQGHNCVPLETMSLFKVQFQQVGGGEGSALLLGADVAGVRTHSLVVVMVSRALQMHFQGGDRVKLEAADPTLTHVSVGGTVVMLTHRVFPQSLEGLKRDFLVTPAGTNAAMKNSLNFNPVNSLVVFSETRLGQKTYVTHLAAKHRELIVRSRGFGSVSFIVHQMPPEQLVRPKVNIAEAA